LINSYLILNIIRISNMNKHIFETCSKINDLLTDSKEKEAREEFIKLLDYLETNQIEYTSIVNHLIRETGLYPYIHTDTANWADKFVCAAFKVNTGDKEEKHYIGNNHYF